MTKRSTVTWILVGVFAMFVLPVLIFVGEAVFSQRPAAGPPKFSKIAYVSTENHRGCLAVFTDDSCYTIYHYTATGSELDIINSATADLQKSGYQLDQRDDGSPYVTCGSAVVSADGTTYSDKYYFIKSGTGNSKQTSMSVEFLPEFPYKNSLKGDIVGCADSRGSYKIAVNPGYAS